MKRLNVLYVGAFEMPDKNAAAHRVLNNARILKKLNHNVIFFGYSDEVNKQEVVYSTFDGFECYALKKQKSLLGKINSNLKFNKYKEIIDKREIDLVITYNLHFMLLNKLRKYCKKKHVKIIADITEWYEHKFSLIPGRLLKWIDTNIVMRRTNKKVDGLILISKYLENYYKNVKPFLLLPPLIDISENIDN